MKDKNKCVRYDMLVLKMSKMFNFLNIILIKKINFYHSFPTISKTIILMHTNSEVLRDVSNFSSHNEFMVTDLFSFRGTNGSLNYVLFAKCYFYHLKEQWQPKFLFMIGTENKMKKCQSIVWSWRKHFFFYKNRSDFNSFQI